MQKIEYIGFHPFFRVATLNNKVKIGTPTAAENRIIRSSFDSSSESFRKAISLELLDEDEICFNFMQATLDESNKHIEKRT